jgi:hypothetical protein
MDSSLSSIVAAQFIQDRMAEAGSARAGPDAKRTWRRVPQPPARRRFGRSR